MCREVRRVKATVFFIFDQFFGAFSITSGGIPSGNVALLALSDATILFISFLESGGKSKLKESG